MTNGWYDPQWSRSDVFEERESVRPDVWDAEDDPAPAVWLVRQLWERLSGFPEDNGDGTYYSGESDQHAYTGVDVSVAAHASGFSDQELREASAIITAVKVGYPDRWSALQSAETYAEFMGVPR